MYEEILLMKKIVEYFNKLQKVDIANIINAELQKEFQRAPDFQEPEYAKDDLTTIFFRHVKLKRRQSEALLKKSNLDKSTISKKSKTNAPTLIPDNNNNENQNNIQINNDSSDLLKDTNHSILAPINTNRLSENPIRKSQFLPDIESTPTQSTNIRIEKREATLENTIISNDSTTDQRNYENGDSDSIIFCNPSENFHQKIILDPEEFVESYDISNFNNDYEAFIRHSQLDNYTSESNNDVNNDDEVVKMNENVSHEEIEQHERIGTGNEEKCNNQYEIPSEESISINIETDNEAQIINNYNESFQCEQIQSQSSESIDFDRQIKSKETNEIAIQCDPDELFTENQYEIRENRKRFLSQDEDRNNKNMKKAKITEIDNIIDLDDEVKEMENNEKNMEIFDDISDNVGVQENKVSNRARKTSLSSIDTLPDEVHEKIESKSRKRVVNKSAIIYKNDKKLDMKRRILLTDGWILWPRSLLSSSLKHYSENEFIEVLGLDIDAVNNMNKKDLLDRFLESMHVENLISKIHHSSKKIDLYIKLSSPPEDSLQCLDIPLDVYTDNLWNKSSGPKNGRKLCAEGAPEIVKDLLHLELNFVNNFL